MSKPKLKHCPFCGTYEELRLVRENPKDSYPIYYVRCSRVCGAIGPAAEYLWDLGLTFWEARARAVLHWNRRRDKEVREE